MKYMYSKINDQIVLMNCLQLIIIDLKLINKNMNANIQQQQSFNHLVFYSFNQFTTSFYDVGDDLESFMQIDPNRFIQTFNPVHGASRVSAVNEAILAERVKYRRAQNMHQQQQSVTPMPRQEGHKQRQLVQIVSSSKVVKLQQNQIKLADVESPAAGQKRIMGRNTQIGHRNTDQGLERDNVQRRSAYEAGDVKSPIKQASKNSSFEISENFHVRQSQEHLGSGGGGESSKMKMSSYASKASQQSLHSIKNSEQLGSQMQMEGLGGHQVRMSAALANVKSGPAVHPQSAKEQSQPGSSKEYEKNIHIRISQAHAQSAKNAAGYANGAQSAAAAMLPGSGLEAAVAQASRSPEQAKKYNNLNRKLVSQNKVQGRNGQRLMNYHSAQPQCSSRKQPSTHQYQQSQPTNPPARTGALPSANQLIRKQSSSNLDQQQHAPALGASQSQQYIPNTAQQRYHEIQKIYQKKAYQQNQALLGLQQPPQVQSRSFAQIPRSSLQEYQSQQFQQFQNIQTQNHDVYYGQQYNQQKQQVIGGAKLQRSKGRNNSKVVLASLQTEQPRNAGGHPLNALNAQQIQVKLDSRKSSAHGIEETRDSIKTTIKSTKMNLENYISNNKKAAGSDQYKLVQGQKESIQQIQPFVMRYQTQQKNGAHAYQHYVNNGGSEVYNGSQPPGNDQYRAISQINYVTGQKLKQNGDTTKASINQKRPKSSARSKPDLQMLVKNTRLGSNQQQSNQQNKLYFKNNTNSKETYAQKHAQKNFSEQI